MKLRLKNNSVRLRLTQNEIDVFNHSGCVEEAIEFGAESHQRFVYRLESNAETETMRAIFEKSRITIFVPNAQAGEWINTARIGMTSTQEIGGGKTLRLLVEKDFACLEQSADDDDEEIFP